MSDSLSSPDVSGPFFVRVDGARWRVEPMLNRVTPPSGDPLQLEPRVMQLLVALAQEAGTVRTREDLLATVWHDTVVNDEALTRAVSELRKTFDDSAASPAVIETIRGTGYRFIAPVESVDSAPSAPSVERERPVPEAAIPEDASDADEGSDAPPASTSPATSSARKATPWLARPAVVGALLGAVVIFVAAAVGAVSWGTQSDESASALLETRPFTTYPGRERVPALSPDGSRVAFAWTGETGDTYDIYLKQANTADPLRLTNFAGTDAFPAWSPDGTTVAFLRVENDTTHSIYTVPALGGTPRKLLETRSAFYGLDWSPDGRALLFAVRAAPNAPYRIARLDLATRDTTLLSDPPASSVGDVQPRWSPSGDAIAFIREARTGGADLYLMNADGSAPRTVTRNGLGIRGLDWMHDGERLVYASYQSGTFGLWAANAATGTVTWLPTRAERIYYPSVALHTGDLVYEEYTYEKNVWEIDLAADAAVPPERPLITSTRWDCEAYYSPDGERLVFTSARSGTLELWMSAADGANPVQLTDFGGAFVGNPRWSPDGDRVAFYATPDGHARVFVMDVAGGTPQPVRPKTDADGADANDWVTGWSRDGQRIYFASDRSGSWNLWTMRPDGSAPTPVTQTGGFAARESVGGDSLFYSKHAARGLWMRPTEGGPEVRVVEDLAPHDWGNWDVTADGLYFVRRTDEGAAVAFYRFADQTTETVTSIPNIATPSLAVSPDGTRLLYARIERSNSDLVVAQRPE